MSNHSDHEVQPETTPAGGTANPYSRVGRAEAIIQRNVMWALGAGVVPLPLFDIAAVTAVDLKMMQELSELYSLSFKTPTAKKIIYSLLSGLGAVGIGAAFGSSLAKLLPGLGTTLGVVSVPAFAGAFTHALGKIYLMHLEAGGTLLDFDPNAMRSYFTQEFKKAQKKDAPPSVIITPTP